MQCCRRFSGDGARKVSASLEPEKERRFRGKHVPHRKHGNMHALARADSTTRFKKAAGTRTSPIAIGFAVRLKAPIYRRKGIGTVDTR